jgi:hypothetical protein
MKNFHIVLPDLFLPPMQAEEVCAGLKLPALEIILARGARRPLREDTLEAWLCGAYGVKGQAIAPVTLIADGVEPGKAYWLRADPVNLDIRRDQLVLQTDVPMGADEAEQLCADLNAHFAGAGLRFIAPHPQRWYLRLDAAPGMTTLPLAQVAGMNVRAHLPQGADAMHWHRVLNEIQMLMFAHAVNQAREARGELPANSVWLWGGGYAPEKLLRPYGRVCGDSDLAAAFARVSGIPCGGLPDDATQCGEEEVLIVWEGLRRALQHGDLHAWRDELLHFERACAAPLLAALRAGRIAQLTLDAVQDYASRRLVLTRGAMWKLWRQPKRLGSCSLM